MRTWEQMPFDGDLWDEPSDLDLVPDWDRDGDFDVFDLAITRHAYEVTTSGRTGGGGCCVLAALGGVLVVGFCACAVLVLLRSSRT